MECKVENFRTMNTLGALIYSYSEYIQSLHYIQLLPSMQGHKLYIMNLIIIMNVIKDSHL